MCTEMEEQTKNLETHFNRFKMNDEELDQFGNELILGECWIWKEPEHVEFWSIVLTPMSNHLSFTTKYTNCLATLPMSLHELVTKVDTGPADYLTISYKTNHPEQNEEYIFSYIVPTTRVTFSIATTCRSYQDTNLSAMAKDIAKHIDEKRWHSKDSGALPLKVLASRLDAVV